MKILHYQIYERGAVGMANILMSVENALIIAKLTNRDKIVFYCSQSLYNSTTGKTLFNLYDIHYNYELVKSDLIDNSIESLSSDFHNSCIYYNDYPDNNFLNGRDRLINLAEYENKTEFRTLNTNTLSFYSYLFYIKDQNLLSNIQEFIRTAVVPKRHYLYQANIILKDIISKYGEFNSIAVRRGDYLYVDGTNNNNTTPQEFNLNSIDKSKFLLIHTDETNVQYFETIGFSNYCCIDNRIANQDPVEKGLISLIIASYSTNFIGTLFSTFTSYIQRYRMYNFKQEKFKFLYSQREDLILYNGEIQKTNNTYSWNQLPNSLKDMAFWVCEYQESYKTK